jgi:hypothetical protein
MNFNDLILLLDSRAENLKHLASMEVPFKIDEFGSEYYKTKDGERIEYPNGTKLWYDDGKLHRLDGPAVEWADGSKAWYVNDKPHRTDGPAVEYTNGYKKWFINGRRKTEEQFNKWRAKHNPIKESRLETIKQLASMEVPIHVSDDGTLECYKTKDGIRYEYADGQKEWFAYGNRHRLDGPAVIKANGSKYWYVNGKHHRIDGPAVEWADGSKAWFVNDEKMTEEDFNKWKAKNNPVTENRKANIMQLAMYEKEMQDILNTNPILQAVVDHYWSYMGSLVFGPKKGDDKNDFVEAILKYAENFGYTDKKNPDLFLEKDFDMYIETRDEGMGEKDEAGLFNEYVSWLVDMLQDNNLI